RTKGGGDRGWFTGRSKQHGHRSRILRVRLIGLREHRTIDTSPSRIRYDAHHGPPPRVLVWIAEFETLAERILVWPVRSCCGFVDDGDTWSASAVAIRERASADQWHLQDPEEVRRDDVEGERLLNRLRPALDREAGRVRQPVQENGTPRGHRGH